MNIGIIGNGFVGNATKILVENSKHNLLVYDLDPLKCYPKGLQFNDLKKCDLVFISVPTPMYLDGQCNTSIVESCVNKLKNIIDNNTFIIIRSTVPVGLSDKLGVYFMPEFLTEKNWDYDFRNNKSWIFGMPKENKLFIDKITNLITDSYLSKSIRYNNLHFISNKEAELIKYFKNTFLATKVSFCNEIYQFCKKKNINFDNVTKFVKYDDRIGNTHMKVPGPDGSFGYGGTCFPKDINSLYHQFKNNNVKSIILNSVIQRNELYDRKKLDWLSNKGRAVSSTEQKNILIINGYNIIGLELSNKLLKDEKYRIICIDDRNIKDDLIPNKNYVYIKTNIIEPIRLQISNIHKIYFINDNLYETNENKLDLLDKYYFGIKNIIRLSKNFNTEIINIEINKNNNLVNNIVKTMLQESNIKYKTMNITNKFGNFFDNVNIT